MYKYTPQIPADIDMSESIMKQVEQKDRFLFFPYDSMQPFLHMLNEAAEDPNVVSIKMTLYRVANDSKVVEALINAAETVRKLWHWWNFVPVLMRKIILSGPDGWRTQAAGSCMVWIN